MKNLPIKKGIEKQLQNLREGIWKIEGKDQYLKIASKLWQSQIKLSPKDYPNFKEAVEDAIIYARVYNKLIEEKIYPPETGIAIYKDDQGDLTLMVVMPELNTEHCAYDLIKKKIKTLEKKFNLKEDGLWGDLSLAFNWGYDKKRNLYAHDLHVIKDVQNPKQVLKIAKKMGIK